MSAVIVEREITRNRPEDELRAMVADADSCMKLHGVRAVVHYLATDGTRLTCVFDAPDAEAFRHVAERAGLRLPKAVWAATVHPAPGEDAGRPLLLSNPAHSLAVVERSFAASVTYEEIDALEKTDTGCFDLHRVRFLRSYFSFDRRRMLCLYEAPDVESVRTANRQIGAPFDIAWGARVINPAA